ncbi:hypothetical protein GIB67_011276 [Kingdonia uniflora]|uniref:Prephenate dehydratase domain-containing protein n=1 Tax=Kingdonia uniflora TaxID=39325 RepID=A0A7J7MNE8_9MAGN|nr:hypothetical protein GIB67_011276 [Kingdonia uniflora]
MGSCDTSPSLLLLFGVFNLLLGPLHLVEECIFHTDHSKRWFLAVFTWAFQTYHTESGRHNFVYDVEKSLYTLEGLPQNKHEFSVVLDDITLTITNRTTANGSSGTGVGSHDGVPGVYSEAATLKAYPECEAIPCDQFEASFKAVELWLVDKAVLPIENTLGGSIHRNYDLLLRHRLHIVGEVQLAVNHSLLELPAGAAQFVALNRLKDTGVVASARAADIYGLNVLVKKNQDDFENITCFLILAREPIIPKADRPFKTSIVFTLEEGLGVLFKVLAVFAMKEINLTKIESWPQKKRPLRVVDELNAGCAKYFDYLFYIDFEASTTEERKYEDDQMLKSCGIKTDSKFTQVKGRVLSDPKKLMEPTRVNDQYLTNILLKINGNLGGLNSMLTTEHGLNILMISKAPAMMLGMDVPNGSPGQANVPYISKLLLDFYTSSGKGKPDQMIVFRGVGHEVPLHRPQLALVLFMAILSGTAMPTPPQIITDY